MQNGNEFDSSYSKNEFVNALTHGVGLVVGTIAGMFLVLTAVSSGDAWQIVGCSIFATTLIGVYAFSTLSHCNFTTEIRNKFERCDQGFIYLFVVGTYTPLSLVYLRTGWWWLLFAVMWTIALTGFMAKVAFYDRINRVAVWSYVLLGWLPVCVSRLMVGMIPLDALWLMLVGGLCYTVGVVFLICDVRRFYFHAIWHLFVIAGSTFHFVAIYLYAALPNHSFPNL